MNGEYRRLGKCPTVINWREGKPLKISVIRVDLNVTMMRPVEP
jgi:hypothetical protein